MPSGIAALLFLYLKIRIHGGFSMKKNVKKRFFDDSVDYPD